MIYNVLGIIGCVGFAVSFGACSLLTMFNSSFIRFGVNMTLGTLFVFFAGSLFLALKGAKIRKRTERFNKLVLDDNNNIAAIGTLYTARKNNHNTVDEYDYDGIIAKYNSNLEKLDDVRYGDERDDFFTDVIFIHNKYIIVGYSSYEDGSYMSKFISYSKAFKVLEVE